MSRRELERAEVMGRVASGDLRLQHAAEMLELSYRQTKRVWRRYRERGYEDGRVEVYYRGQRIPWHEIAEPVRRTAQPSPPAAGIVLREKAKPDHPWRWGYEMRVGMRPSLAAPPVVPRPSASP